jgi:1-acyl-sn-glycerol-3-phosphate acyltransferase
MTLHETSSESANRQPRQHDDHSAGLTRARLPQFGKRRAGAGLAAAAELPYQRHLLRQSRALRRILWLLLIVPAGCLIQALLLTLPGRAHENFGMAFWSAVSRALGLSIRIAGHPARQTETGRPIIYVSNHSSWLDIPALGAKLSAPFVAKTEVGSWPLIGTAARLGATVFVSRNRKTAARERDEMEKMLAAGRGLILFPEGTSSDGSRVLPFHAAFFAAAYGPSKPLIQPVSVVYDRLGGLPVGRASRAVFAWYGDMALVPHLFQVAQCKGKRVTLLFHASVEPADYPNRKALAAAVHGIIDQGAAELRQNRPARPLPQAPAKPRAEPASHEAFA